MILKVENWQEFVPAAVAEFLKKINAEKRIKDIWEKEF